MDRVHRADDDHAERVAALEEYLTLGAPTKAASVLPVRAPRPSDEIQQRAAQAEQENTGER